MITLACRHIAPDCLDTLSAEDSSQIQKLFLDHVHTKHPTQWSRWTHQFRATWLVMLRNRFRAAQMPSLS